MQIPNTVENRRDKAKYMLEMKVIMAKQNEKRSIN